MSDLPKSLALTKTEEARSLFSILPYTVQAPAYNKINFNNWPGWATNFPVYNGFKPPDMRCPSTPLPVTRDRDGQALMIANYPGIAGATAGTGASRTSVPGNRADAARNGVLSDNKNFAFSDITDGSSNTAMVGEQSDLGASQTDIRSNWDWGSWMDVRTAQVALQLTFGQLRLLRFTPTGSLALSERWVHTSTWDAKGAETSRCGRFTPVDCTGSWGMDLSDSFRTISSEPFSITCAIVRID